ncbi:helix-turn-helix domain-containing protein [Bailinhaonella thermotolerans]|uniref:ArsR family transcriptional regulator n=1 Tax=Bailinhaonella thermotolerans TaxID=1070861 RepID=A0A3A4AM82_9ACTN|nr:helix-turn-helix domain-containing protein [Bailinhaonella thermotolerans]RJL30061.1 ArsR family transcriptional regulator [Bailinhaonella thermotolerans]
MDALDLLLHPVRLRIVHAMSGGSTRTTADLCARLSDVPKTTVYRHVALLAEAGVLEVASEQRVHGAVERRYRLRRDRARIDGDSMSLDDHRQAFPAALATLLAEFDAYLSREGADPSADLVGYRQLILWLTREELKEVIAEFTQVLSRHWHNAPTGGRAPYLLSPIVFPTATPADPDPVP